MQATRGTVSYTYLPGDLVGSVSVTGGEWAQYGYYPDGSLQAVEWSGASGGTFGYSYRLNGQYDTITFPNGQTRSHGYDDQGRLVEIANAHPAGGLLARFGYGYDLDHATGTFSRLGQRVTMTTEVPAQGLVNAVTQYRYDPAYQLTRADYPAAAPFGGETHSWAYDAIGNRVATTVNGTTTGYTYQKAGSNPNNWQRLTSDGARSYTYDANGNTLTRGGETYGWDSENRMTSISGTAAATYRYDYQGRRTSKTVGGVTTTYLYDGLNLIAETGASYLYGPGIDEPLAVTRGGPIAYYATDGLGSVALLADAFGAVANSYAYDAWGVTRTDSETLPQPLRYTAREVGEVAGQYFYRARYYGAGMGRFLSEDPLAQFDFQWDGELVGPKLFEAGYTDWNHLRPFTYADSDPANRTDALGLDACCNRPWTACWSKCIEIWRWDWTPNWVPVLSAVPKKAVGSRVVRKSQPVTTLTSRLVSVLRKGATPGGRAARGAARIASRVATPITILEGWWDLSVIIACAEDCRRYPCGAR